MKEAMTDFVGVSLVVTPRTSVVRVNGWADRSSGEVWTPDTRSQIASISKQFVVACALILVDQGRLGLDDPITRYLAAVGPGWGSVSVRQLITHTSGMTHWTEQAGYVPSLSLPAEKRLRLLLAGPRAGAGEFRYSSPGYIVLAATLAAAADAPYPELVYQLVVKPLGLNATSVGRPGPGPTARGYRGAQPVTPWELASMPGTGDVWSTAGDLARFVRALHGGTLLPTTVQPLLRDIAVPYADSSETPIRAQAYAAGHFVGTVNGRLAYLHPGDNPGYQCLALWLPDERTAVVVLSNDEEADVESEALAVVTSA